MDRVWARDAIDLVVAGMQGEVTNAVELPESQDPSQGVLRVPASPVSPQAQYRPPKLRRRLCVQSGLVFVIKLICM